MLYCPKYDILWILTLLRIHWRLSTILKTSQKVYEGMFFDICKSMFIVKVYSIPYKFPSDNINGTKNTDSLTLMS